MDRTRDLGERNGWQRPLQRWVVRVPVVQLCGAFAVALSAMAGNAFAMSPSPDTAPAAKYMNPLGHAKVTPERIDQGVDYAGTGSLAAIGWAKITYVQTQNTGWPGAFIEYRLLHGYRAGRYVYYAEGVSPAKGIRVGRLVRPGRFVAHLIPGWSSGIEIGWGANIGTETLAAAHHQYTYPTRCGKNFSNFVKSLGGPPGRPNGTSTEAATRYGRP